MQSQKAGQIIYIIPMVNRFSCLFLVSAAAIIWAQPAPAARKPAVYQPNALDSATKGREITLSKDKLLLEEGGAKDSDVITDSSDAAGPRRYKVKQGYRIQAYATTNFKDAENKKDDLLSVLDEPVYVVYEEPFYKIRVGNFDREEDAKELKRTLVNMGNDAWIVTSKVRIRVSDEPTGKKPK